MLDPTSAALNFLLLLFLCHEATEGRREAAEKGFVTESLLYAKKNRKSLLSVLASHNQHGGGR